MSSPVPWDPFAAGAYSPPKGTLFSSSAGRWMEMEQPPRFLEQQKRPECILKVNVGPLKRQREGDGGMGGYNSALDKSSQEDIRKGGGFRGSTLFRFHY